MSTILTITQKNNILEIRNESEFAVEIHLVPKKPKRKVEFQMVIHPGQMYKLDGLEEWNTSDHYFRFVKP